MRVFTILIMGLYLAFTGTVHAGQQSAVDRIIAKQKTIRTLSADFTQEKKSALLTTPLVSKGRFSYMAPDKVAWIYSGQVEIVSNGKDLTVYYPELKQAEIVPLQNSLVRLPLNFNLAEFRKHFRLDVKEKKSSFIVTLVPIEETSMFSKMILDISEAGVPNTVEIFEKGGDRSIIRFTNQKVNKKLPKNTFSLNLPADTVIKRFQQQ